MNEAETPVWMIDRMLRYLKPAHWSSSGNSVLGTCYSVLPP